MAPVSIYNTSSLVSQVIINHISEIKRRRIVVHDAPTTNDIIHDLGPKNRVFSLGGIVTGSVGSDTLRALPGYTGSIIYTSNVGSLAYIPKVVVYFYDLKFDDRTNPFYRSFTIEAIELL